MEKHTKKQGEQPTVNLPVRKVLYWRERFSEEFERFADLTLKELANQMGELDDTFLGLDGYVRLSSVKQKRGSYELTELAVQLLEQLRPKTKVKSTHERLKRQGLVAPK